MNADIDRGLRVLDYPGFIYPPSGDASGMVEMPLTGSQLAAFVEVLQDLPAAVREPLEKALRYAICFRKEYLRGYNGGARWSRDHSFTSEPKNPEGFRRLMEWMGEDCFGELSAGYVDGFCSAIRDASKSEAIVAAVAGDN